MSKAGLSSVGLVVALMAASVRDASRGAERIARQALAALSHDVVDEASTLLGF